MNNYYPGKGIHVVKRGIAINEYNVICADAVVQAKLDPACGLAILLQGEENWRCVNLDGKSEEFKQRLFEEFIDFLYPEPRQIGECPPFFSFPLRLEKD